ncbi:MAG: TadE family protein [Pseudomonadota bacterium]
MKTLTRSGRTCQSPGLQRGLVVIELAITLPLVLLIMLATAEVGRAIYQYTTLTKAVEAGSRYYASTALDSSIPDVTKKITTENLIVFGSPQAGATSVLPNFFVSNVTEIELGPLGTIPVDHVRVSANYDYAPFISGIPILGSVASFTMTATHTMRAI